jgi:hypothetical protein
MRLSLSRLDQEADDGHRGVVRTSVASKVLLAVEATVVLAAVWIAASLASVSPVVDGGGCPDPRINGDPHFIVGRGLIVLTGLALAYAFDYLRRRVVARLSKAVPG